MKKLVPVAIVFAAVIIALLMAQFKPRAQQSEAQDRAVAVTTEELQITAVELQVRSQGTVVPRTRTNLISEVSGVVVEVSPAFIVGGTFAEGDVLIKLDPTDYQVAIQRAEAMLLSAEAQLLSEQARSQQAQKEWEMTGRPLEEAPVLALRTPFLAEAQSRLLQAKAELRQAEVKLQRTVIRAPYRGMVSAKSVDVGQYVTIGSRLAELFAIDFAEVRLPMTQKDLSMLDDLALLGSDDSGNTRVELIGSVNGQQSLWKADLVRSEGSINERNRVQYLVARIIDPYNLEDNSQPVPLLMGTFVEAQIRGKTIDQVYPLPRHALRSGNRVAVVDANQRLALKPVEYDFEDQSYYYIDQGLEGVVEIVTSSIGVMVEGMRLKPVNEPQLEAL
ncbi:MAG: efflux RND transporter periplasmic adaptor subunit [Porticoccaceae bacterium]